ncbi:hypothetical protein D1007_50856 [Hordeum vulgare]|nr:hypothetical protein D1007_50856 [Hordeum vulgare]
MPPQALEEWRGCHHHSRSGGEGGEDLHRPTVVSTLPSPVKPLDEKTSRILERLEAPKAKKQRTGKPPGTGAATTSGRGGGGGSSTLVKKPLLPFEPSASQPLKPSFNRVRRKAVS